MRIHLAREDPTKAGEVATLGLEVVSQKGISPPTYAVAPLWVEALLAHEERPKANGLVSGLARAVRGRDAPAGRAALAFCRGLLAEANGRGDTAARWFAEAERTWSGLPNPYEATRARERRGQCMLAQGNGRGGDCLIEALQDFEGLGANWDSARTRALLRAHRIALPYPLRGGRRNYRSDLSPREREVAELAGSGRTNKEIAEALFISRRTVESHVAAALRKSGLKSRSELVLALNEAQATKSA